MKVFSLILLSLGLICSVWAQETIKVIAKVNDEVITSKDLQEYCNILAYRYGNDNSEVPANLQEFKEEAFYRLIEDKLILQEAKKEKIEIPDYWITAKLDEIKRQYPENQKFEASLIEKGLTVTSLRTRIKEQFLNRQIIEKYVEGYVSISPQQISDYYNAHLAEFSSPLRYVLWVATLDTQEKAVEISQAIDRKGFVEAEKDYDKYFVKMEATREELREEISAMLNQLKENSYLVKHTNKTTYLVYLEQVIVASALALDKVKGQIHNKLRSEQINQRFKEWITGLKEKAFIKYYQ